MCTNNIMIPMTTRSNPTSRDSFEWDGTKITKFIGNETDVVIPDDTTEIGEFVFYHRESLTSVVIPKGVTKIGRDAFQDCSSLTSVVIPESVTEIEDHAFYGCSSLTSVVIPKSVTKIGWFSFDHCPNLTIYAPAGSTAEEYAKEYEIPFEVIS